MSRAAGVAPCGGPDPQARPDPIRRMRPGHAEVAQLETPQFEAPKPEAPRIEIAQVDSFEALGAEWRALEARAKPSFFQSWTWVGCLAEERFPDPVVLRATVGGQTLGLALCNRRRGRLCLTESGDAGLDAPFVEHNAPLLAPGLRPDVLPWLFRAAWSARGVRRLVLSGVPPAVATAAGGLAWRRQARAVPLVDLARVREAGGNWLASLSANTRYQLRRSAKHYGGPRLIRAATEAEALDGLAALATLHAERWRERGQPGAFATPWLQRFHRTLIGRGLGRGEVDLLRVVAGDGRAIGYLYNFRLGGRVSAYQSGLDLAGAGPQGKPGLTCHQLAIERALAEGDAVYDLLAGASRYKRSLANAESELMWVELVRPWSLAGLAVRLRAVIQARMQARMRPDPAQPTNSAA
ncbi:MAG: Acetyltransferase involved in cellulose biosynthesis, CelD/BcsL family [Belnapia sp.]|nr:Acetyltransferase involved in cellulose biosynthesis, CelD/BcsL family [Belnapia sp.]